jgi:ABC-type multidrug transport system fused ATPase/permease subunit
MIDFLRSDCIDGIWGCSVMLAASGAPEPEGSDGPVDEGGRGEGVSRGVPGLLGKLSDLLDRRTRFTLAVATGGTVVIAVLDTVAVALVLPLVNLATGSSEGSRAVGLVSDVFGSPDDQTLTIELTACVVALFIAKDLGAMAFAWWMSGFVFAERVRTSARILRHFLTSPYTQVSRRSSAELLRTMDFAVMQVFNFTVNGLMYAFSSAVSILAVAVALLVVSPIPTLVVVAYFGCAGLIFLRVIKPRAAAASEVMADASLAGWRTAFAALGGIKELQIRGTQEHFVQNFEQAQLRGAYAGRTAAFLAGLPKYLLEILFIVAVGLILLVNVAGSSGDARGSVGLVALFVAAGFRVLPSVSALLTSASNVRVGTVFVDLVHEEILAARRSTHVHRTSAALPFGEAVRVEDVTFRYPESNVDALTGVTFSVPRGTTTALVGGSGAGKTTLVDVILGLHSPSSGRVCVDGTDIKDRLEGWQRNLAYVPQEVYILDATLAENIAFDQDRDEIDEQRLARCVEKAQLGGLVATLPQGMDTPVGEKGTRLSGGQRQRIGIARALYREPEMLVLDEATSALDNETEHRIGQTLAALRGEITVVIVAHRLSTVRDADQIVFLGDGRVQATGTFSEVREQSPEFARMVELGSLEPAASGGESRPDGSQQGG